MAIFDRGGGPQKMAGHLWVTVPYPPFPAHCRFQNQLVR
jgi:hypothetical protein